MEALIRVGVTQKKKAEGDTIFMYFDKILLFHPYFHLVYVLLHIWVREREKGRSY